MKNARQVAFEALLKMHQDKAYSNLTLDAVLSKANLDTRDRSFVSNLFYGVVERQITIDYQLQRYLSQHLSKTKDEVLTILRMGVYQILFMDRVPTRAAVNESVNLTRANGVGFGAAVVNAVLRKVDQNGLVLPKGDDRSTYMSVKYSCNNWLVRKLIREYGEEVTENFLESSLKVPKICIRVNSTKVSQEKLMELLEKEGVIVTKTYLKNALFIKLTNKSIDKLQCYRAGLFHVQDLSSQLCVRAIEAKAGHTVIDLCSAPGGKTYTTAQYMKNQGEVLAFDIHDHKIRLVENGAKRLGLTIIKGRVSDASKINQIMPKADRVLCDVPCSGFGIIGRKPEIKYKSEDCTETLPRIQYEILNAGATYVKDGGRLIYSTCTLNKDENEGVCEKFLEKHEDFVAISVLNEISADKYKTLMPNKNDCDGFFVACFEKRG
ncbi:MAG: 16S rRNA (cytosine(967)-C(5))-methyltransferase RsmB [Clostridia bacterium]